MHIAAGAEGQPADERLMSLHDAAECPCVAQQAEFHELSVTVFMSSSSGRRRMSGDKK